MAFVVSAFSALVIKKRTNHLAVNSIQPDKLHLFSDNLCPLRGLQLSTADRQPLNLHHPDCDNSPFNKEHKIHQHAYQTKNVDSHAETRSSLMNEQAKGLC